VYNGPARRSRLCAAKFIVSRSPCIIGFTAGAFVLGFTSARRRRDGWRSGKRYACWDRPTYFGDANIVADTAGSPAIIARSVKMRRIMK